MNSATVAAQTACLEHIKCAAPCCFRARTRSNLVHVFAKHQQVDETHEQRSRGCLHTWSGAKGSFQPWGCLASKGSWATNLSFFKSHAKREQKCSLCRLILCSNIHSGHKSTLSGLATCTGTTSLQLLVDRVLKAGCLTHAARLLQCTVYPMYSVSNAGVRPIACRQIPFAYANTSCMICNAGGQGR